MHIPSVASSDQFELFDLRVTVQAIEGRSVCGMEVGDYFEVRGSGLTLPPGQHFCVYALQAIMPILPAMQRPVSPGDWMARDNLVACPDPDERVIMRVERIGSRSVRTDDVT